MAPKDGENVRITFVGPLNSTFVQRDIEILKKHFYLDIIDVPKKSSEWSRYILRVKKSVKKSDIFFGWFAGWHTFPGIFYSKKHKKLSLIVVGGFDVASVPEIKYGAFANLKEKIPAKYVLKNTNKILVVDPSLKKKAMKNAKLDGNNIEYLPTTYDPNYWLKKGNKERMVLTVASIKNIKRIKIKGIDTFIKSAKYLPDVKFLIVGVKNGIREYIQKIAPKNVEVIGMLPQEKLLSYYQKAKVYCQLSISEGLPNTLCEAMLCECIPVGTRIDGISTAMGDVGFYVPYGDPKITAYAIKKALEAPEDMGKKARERIKNMFPLEMREERLVKIITEMVGE